MKPKQKEKLDSWIFDSFQVTAGGLALYRIFVSLTILFFLLPSPGFYPYLANLPADFYAPPPGPMMLFESFPPEAFLLTVHVLLVASLLAMLAGYKTKWSSLLAGLLMLTLKGFIFSIGKINHDLLLSVVPILFAFSGWGYRYSMDAVLKQDGRMEPENNGWPLTLLALFIGFMMFTAAFPKILGGWLDPSTQAAQGHFLNQVYQKGRADLLAEAALNWNSTLFWEFLDIATILFEAGFLIAIFRPHTTRLFLCIAVLFHFSTMMLMNIAFLFNFVAYAAFLDWTRINSVLNRAGSVLTGQKTGRRVGGFLLAAALSLLYGAMLWADRAGLMALESDLRAYEVIFITLAVPVAIWGLASLFYRHYVKPS